MGAPAVLKIDIVGDASKALKAMDDTEKGAGSISSAFGKMAGVLGGALAVGGVVAFGKSALDAATESKVAAARIEQVFSSMGDVTGNAAQAAEDYAGVMSRRIGVDDEVILAGQAQLATFGEVSSETARMAGIFDRATTAGADLAAAGFGSIESNAVQLGKALQDPTKGMTALAKSGVTFTDAQKEQIKVMQESGDLLGAQKIVLGAVEAQVGGTAEATSTAGGRMKVAFGEVQEQIGGFLLPIFSTLANVLANKVFPVIEDVVASLKKDFVPVLAVIDKALRAAIAGGFEKLTTWLQAAWPQIKEFLSGFAAAVAELIPHLLDFGKHLLATVIPAVQRIAAAVMQAAPPLLSLARDVFMWLATNVLPLLGAAFDRVVPVVANVVEKIAALVGWLANNRDVLAAILAPIAAYVAIMQTWAAIQAIVTAATAAWAAVQAVLNAVMAANPFVLVIVAIVALVAGIILAYEKVGWFRAFVDASFQAIVAAFNFLKDAAAAVFNWVSANWPILLVILTGPFGLAVTLIVRNFDTIRDVIAGVIGWVANNWPLLLAIITGPIGLAVLAVVRNFDTIKDAVTGVYDWIVDKFNAVVGFFSGVADRIGGIASNIANAVKGPLNAVIRAWNGLEFTVPSVDVGPIHFGGQTIGLPDIPTLARGGRVLSTGMALVHEGERFDGGRGFGSTNITVNITHSGLGADSPQLQRDVVNAIRGYTARNGPLGSPIVAPA